MSYVNCKIESRDVNACFEIWRLYAVVSVRWQHCSSASIVGLDGTIAHVRHSFHLVKNDNIAATTTESKMAYAKVDSDLVAQQMTAILQNFESLRGLKPGENRFWDAVIITSADQQQQICFEKQMKCKEQRGEVPLGVHYLVYADPPGCKAGSGGSILHALSCMHKQFGDKMYEYRTLIICAGGWSQRLPTATILGKLFLPLPIGPIDQHYQMIDLKLALYLPFFERMKPGFLVTCSDDIETFYIPPEQDGCDELWSFDRCGFMALGHISSLDVATGHGVYVLPSEAHSQGANTGVAVSKSLLVLQKPSLEMMRETGAILNDNWACTDSIFAFDHNVAAILMDVYGKNEPLTCEVDAYGDFLQAFGTKLDDTFKKILRDSLHNTPITVLLLHQSSFYHLGTMPEYVHQLANLDDGLGKELNFQTRMVNSNTGHQIDSVSRGSMVMHSLVHPEVSIGTGAVVEYCEITCPIVIGNRSLISHCRISMTGCKTQNITKIPSDCCFHTVTVTLNDCVKYVTVAFGIEDDVKLSSQRECARSQLMWLNRPLGAAVKDVGLDKWFPVSGEKEGLVSLWILKIFPVADTMESSFWKTLNLVNGATEEMTEQLSWEGSRLSMEDILQHKNVQDMLEFREKLYCVIRPTSKN